KVPATGYFDPILLHGEGHLMTIAPTGAGKGTGCIVPALLRYPGPVIVIDPKGENVAITARRRREMGQRVVVIDPMGLTEGAGVDTLNPLDLIDVTRQSAVDEVAVLAQTLMMSSIDDRNRYWSHRAMHLVIGATLHAMVKALPGTASLLDVRELVNQAAASPEAVAKELTESPHPEVQRIARMLGIGAPETLGGIVSFAQEMVDFVRGDAIQASLGTTSFDLADVTSGAPLSIYLVLPPHMLESHGRLLRLWLGTLIGCITRRRARPGHATLFIIDEAAQLGELQHLRQAVTLLRGYGLQTWSFWQDASQLRLLYPRDWQTMVNNCRVLQCFGALNRTAADDMAQFTGFGSGSLVLDLPPDEMVLQLAGDEAVVSRLPNYLTDPAFAGQFDGNPYHDPSRAVAPRMAARQRLYVRPVRSSSAPLGTLPSTDPLLGELLAKWKKP
ncbi:MAG: type IV secretory system conjugative DNA transfer family protein, partial [Gammaproteobacteria bacterium]|nr:type IV secretory system conjugative DNA transfer family protein [Gammaproteobacteria bacterium]